MFVIDNNWQKDYNITLTKNSYILYYNLFQVFVLTSFIIVESLIPDFCSLPGYV